MLSGTRANIAVKVFGDDLSTLRRIGERVRDAVNRVPGVVDLSLEQQMDIPFVRFVLNRQAISRYGLHASDVGEAIETSLGALTTEEREKVLFRNAMRCFNLTEDDLRVGTR